MEQTIIADALDNLRVHQRQLDMDGVEVAVSRQALCEVLIGVESALSAALPLTAPPARGQVEVKALEWRGSEGVWAKADALFGATYRITEYAGMAKPFKLETVGFVGPSGHYELLNEGKAAAQADYERRILSALTSPAEPAPATGGVE